MLAETATLLVKIMGESNLSSVAAKSEQSLSKLNTTTKASGTHMVGLVAASAKAEKAIGRLGGAIGHASGKIGGLLSGPLGLIGLTGGILSLGGAIESSVKKVEDFSLGLEKVMTLTGETAQASGTLILLFEKYGLNADRVAQSAAFAEKTLGKLNETQAKGAKVTKSAELQNLELVKAQRQAAGESTKAINKLISEQKGRDAVTAAQTKATASVSKLAALDKQYGLSLVDAKGKVVSYSEELSQLADLYDRNIPASTKAYVASQALGRQYAILAPILALGSAGIREASKEAANLGLNLGGDTVQKMTQFRETMRSLGEQVNILQLKIGMALVPALDDAAHSISAWLTNGGSDQIVSFFKSGATFAGEFADAMQPIVKGFQGLAGVWNGFPAPLKDLLIGGFVANKAGKFLFDKSLFGGIKNVAGGLLGSILGKVPVIGGALDTAAGGVQHVWVDNPGFGAINPTNVVTTVETAAGAITAGAVTSAAAAFTIALAPVAAGLLILATRSQESADKADYAARLATATARGIPIANVPGPGEMAGGPGVGGYANWLAQHTTANAIPANQRNPDRFDRAMFDAVKAGAYAGTNDGIIHNASLFHKAQAVREAAGTMLSRDVLISDLHKGGKLGTGDLVTAQAVALATLNHVRMDKNPDLRSAAANLALIKRTEDKLPADLAAKLHGPIHSLELAINAAKAAIAAAITNKQFTVTISGQTGFALTGPYSNPFPKPAPSKTPTYANANSPGHHLAIGGPVSAGLSYIVGEHGPELFKPKRDGTIVPNHRLQDRGPLAGFLDWFMGPGGVNPNLWNPLSGVTKGDWAHGHRTSEEDLRRMAANRHLTIHANVAVSTRDVNTSQNIKRRYGPTPTQAGAQ